MGRSYLCKGEFFRVRMVKQVAQRGAGGLIPRNIQGQVAWCPERPDPIEEVPAHCGGVGPFQPTPFSDSFISDCPENPPVL